MSLYADQIIWLAVLILTIVIEAATEQITSIWFACGALFALITSLFGAELPVQIIVFCLTSVILLLAIRPQIRRKMFQPSIRTNADSVIGKIGIVIQSAASDASTGQVKVDGHVWTAKPVKHSTLEKGESVIVEAIEGVKIIVRQLEERENSSDESEM